MLEGKSLLDYTNLFSSNEYEKNDKLIQIFSITKKVKMKIMYCVTCGKYKKFKNSKISYIFFIYHFFLLFSVNMRMNMKKDLEKNQLRH